MARPDEFTSMDDFRKLTDAAKPRFGMADYRIASEGYFAAMGIPLIRGRLFEPSDGPDAPHVAVISESLARTKWPGQDPLGRFVQFGNMDGDLRGFRIVGIVGDVRELSPESLPGPIFYGYYQQRPTSRVSIVVRAQSPQTVTTAARQIVRAIDPEVPLQMKTTDEAFDTALAGRRFSLLLIGVFSVCALLLATLGVYGLMAYVVVAAHAGDRHSPGARRRIDDRRLDDRRPRRAAGADWRRHRRRRGAGLSRLLDGMLFGVTATDPAFVRRRGARHARRRAGGDMGAGHAGHARAGG